MGLSLIKKGYSVDGSRFELNEAIKAIQKVIEDAPSDGDTLLKLATGRSGSSAFNGDGTTATFTVTLPEAKDFSKVFVTSTSVASGLAVTGISSTGFTVTFATAPGIGTGNVTFDWLLK